MSYRDYENFVLPLLQKNRVQPISLFAVVREPISWVKSWYTFRARAELSNPRHPNHENYTGNITFSEFVQEVVSENPRSFARIRSQSYYVKRDDGEIGADRIFTTENVHLDLPKFLEQFDVRDLGELPRKNVSSQSEGVDGFDTGAILDFFKEDVDLYNSARNN